MCPLRDFLVNLVAAPQHLEAPPCSLALPTGCRPEASRLTLWSLRTALYRLGFLAEISMEEILPQNSELWRLWVPSAGKMIQTKTE